MKWVAHWGSSGCGGGGVQLSGKLGRDSQGAEASQSCKRFGGQVDGMGNIDNSRKSKTTPRFQMDHFKSAIKVAQGRG